MNYTNERIIHTHLYSQIAFETLRSVEGQLSDGIWENSRAAEKYWLFSTVDTAPNGEVIIKISAESYNSRWHSGHFIENAFNHMTDADILKWFGHKAKQIMQIELKDDPEYATHEFRTSWNRTNNEFESCYLGRGSNVTVSDVYFIYETLIGRDTARKYSIFQHQNIIGEPKSATDTATEVAKREKIQQINYAWTADLKQLDVWKQQQMDLIEAEYNKKRYAMNDAYRAQIEVAKA